MSTPAVLDAFRALQTSRARRAAVAALAAELSSDEWRALKALVDARSFQCDIVGTLPAELVFHVFSHLDISAPFRLQTVSRRWCSLLRSTDLLKPKLRSWYDGTVALEGTSYEDCLQRAQSVQRFRTGRYIEVAATRPRLEPSNRIILTEDFLVHVPYPHRQVCVANLRTGEAWNAATEGREVIAKVIASGELIAFWNQLHTCYIFDFFATRRAKLRLPPSMNQFQACRERTVICGGILDQHIELYIWDLDSQKGRTLRLDQPPFDSAITSPQCLDIQVLPKPSSQTFTLFFTPTCEARWCGHHVQDITIRYYVVTFDGQLVQESTFMIPLPAGATNLAGASITSIHPVDRKGGYRINVFCRYNQDGFTSTLHFDETLQAFRKPEQPTFSSENVRTAWWKDSFYKISLESERLSRIVHIYFHHIRLSGQDHENSMLFRDRAVLDDLMGGTDIALLLNDKFAVVLAFNRTYVFSFVEKAKTADSAVESGSEDEEEGKLVLWKVVP